MKSVLLGLLALVLFQSAPVLAETRDAEAHYQTLLAAAKSGGPVDWQALRFAYIDRPGYVVFGTDDARSAATKMLIAKDWPGLLKAANTLLDSDFTDAKAHRFVAYAYQHLNGSEADIGREYDISDAILKSIETGDGLTPKTAFVVVAVHEEYDLMLFRSWHREKQALQSIDGHVYDVMDVTTKDGKALTFYFQIDRAWAAEAAMFNPK